MGTIVRYGIIGFGLFAERAIAPAFRASKFSKLVALQKRSLAAAQMKAKECSVPLAFDSAEELSAHPDIDAVFIVSANALHCQQTVIAAKAGKHVLIEKPMAMTSSECRTMIDTCKRSGVKLMVGHMLRFSPLLRRMKEIVLSGEIGEVTSARADFIYDGSLSQRQWLFDTRLAGGGPTVDIAVHCLDTLRFVLDDEVVSTAGMLKPKPTPEQTESTSLISLRFGRGTLASICTSFETPIRRTQLEIIGRKGTMAVSNFTQSTIEVSLGVHIGDGSNSRLSRNENFNIPDLYTAEIDHFSEVILQNKEPSIDGRIGLQNQLVLDAVMNSKF